MIETFAAQPQYLILSGFSSLNHVFRSMRHFSIQYPRDFREITSKWHTLVHIGFFNGRGTTSILGPKAATGPKVTPPQNRKLLGFDQLFFGLTLVFLIIYYFYFPTFYPVWGPLALPLVRPWLGDSVGGSAIVTNWHISFRHCLPVTREIPVINWLIN